MELYLKNIEHKMCFFLWLSSVIYAIYCFAASSRKHFQNYDDPYDFTKGWNVFDGIKRDKADFEWETILFLLKNIYPYFIAFLVMGEFIRSAQFSIKKLQYVQVMYSLSFLLYLVGYKATLIILIQPTFFYFLSLKNNNLFIWLGNILCSVLIIVYKYFNAFPSFLDYFNFDYNTAYINMLILCWLNLKCTSFCLLNKRQANVLEFTSYCLYFPTLFTGPFILYDDFKKTYKTSSFPKLYERVEKFLFNWLRWMFWCGFGNVLLHFVYVNATKFQLEFIKELDMWSLCGYGYMMGQFFHIKYIVLYGLSTSLASFENVNVPSLPRCIGRVHLYSDMWKYFDPGLYIFLKRCIFLPIQKLGNNKFLSSFVCFFFVYVWHGVEYYILVWASLNYLGVALEVLANTIYEKKLKLLIHMTPETLRRLQSVVSAPLLCLSAVSNFYFFAEQDVGDIFAMRILTEPISNIFVLLLFLYCCCEVSMDFRKINAHKM